MARVSKLLRPAPAASRRRPALETLEERCLPSASPFYSIDGTGNNLAHADWGAVGQDLLRVAPAAYGDGVSTLAGAGRPSPRLISDVVSADVPGGVTNSRLMADFVYAWGQFLDHDLDLTPEGTTEPANVPVPAG